MLYTDFIVGGKAYKLRLTTRNIVSLENMLGCNPLGIFGDGDSIPTITQMVSILFWALQTYEKDMTMEKAYDIFDEYLQEHSAIDFIKVIVELYQASGIMNKEKN